MNLSEITKINQAANQLAQSLQQVNQSAQQPAQANQANQSALSPEASQVFAQLGQLLNEQQAPTPNENLTDLQQEAAKISARVNALISQANQLEDSLNLAPTANPVSVDELFAAFKEIIDTLSKELSALQKKMQEQKDQDAMKLEQKPTAMKVGESVGDPAFNTQLA